MKSHYHIVLLSSAVINHAFELDDIGIRALMNEGLSGSEGVSCTVPEQQLIRQALEATLPRQRFRSRRQQRICSDLCSGLDNCYLVHPKCRGRTESEEDNKESDVNLAIGDTFLYEEEMIMCESKRIQAKQVLMQQLSSGLSKECSKLARRSLLLECVLISPLD
jgi:hypothetical protein